MPKINNPGCGCCQPPCITDCGDGTSDEIAEWEWSIADLTNEVSMWFKTQVPPNFISTWYYLTIKGYPLPLNQGLAELNGIYIIPHNLVTCQKSNVFDQTFVSVNVLEGGTGTCPVLNPYVGVSGLIWLATAYATFETWGITFSRVTGESDFGFYMRNYVNTNWSVEMFQSRVSLGGDGYCTSKTYQSTVPWAPGGCTVDGSPQTFNNVYTVTPA